MIKKMTSRSDKASPLKAAKNSKASTGAYKKSKHNNVFLKNYKDLDRYIANDFKHLHLPAKATAEYIDWLDHNITQRPLLYITHVLVNELNFKLQPYSLTIKINSNGFKIKKLETQREDLAQQCEASSEDCLSS